MRTAGSERGARGERSEAAVPGGLLAQLAQLAQAPCTAREQGGSWRRRCGQMAIRGATDRLGLAVSAWGHDIRRGPSKLAHLAHLAHLSVSQKTCFTLEEMKSPVERHGYCLRPAPSLRKPREQELSRLVPVLTARGQPGSPQLCKRRRTLGPSPAMCRPVRHSRFITLLLTAARDRGPDTISLQSPRSSHPGRSCSAPCPGKARRLPRGRYRPLNVAHQALCTDTTRADTDHTSANGRPATLKFTQSTQDRGPGTATESSFE